MQEAVGVQFLDFYYRFGLFETSGPTPRVADPPSAVGKRRAFSIPCYYEFAASRSACAAIPYGDDDANRYANH
jgi:hypothetical protein